MRKVLSVLIFFTLPSCSGAGTPEADAPDEAREESSRESDDTGEDESDDTMADDEASSDEGSDEAAADAESSGASGGSAKQLLMQEGTAFTYSFKKSAAGEKAEERCDKASGGDAEKKGKCLAKATPKATSGIRFLKDKEGSVWFIRFEVKGGKPTEYNRIKAEFAEDTGSKVTIKTTGPDKGRGGKGAVPASFELEIPDDYTVIIEEPGRGKTVYETKLGLFDEGDPR
jgi:hypothetical protein